MAKVDTKLGNVYSVDLTQGVGLIQCVKVGGEGKFDIIRILPGSYDKNDLSADRLTSLVSQKELFYTLSPIKHAVGKKMFSFIGNYAIPRGSESPKYFKNKIIVRSEFKGWHIVEEATWKRRFVQELSSEESLLSSWGMISVPDIVERIENNWTPKEWK